MDNTHSTEGPKKNKRKDTFARVAFWQLLAFALLLAFVWCSETMDLPHVLGGEKSPFNPYRACVMSAAIIAAGIIAVGHVYQQQKSIIAPMLTGCLYCHRINTGADRWEHVEEYFMSNFPVDMDRGVCDQCKDMLTDLDALTGKQEAEPTTT